MDRKYEDDFAKFSDHKIQTAISNMVNRELGLDPVTMITTANMPTETLTEEKLKVAIQKVQDIMDMADPKWTVHWLASLGFTVMINPFFSASEKPVVILPSKYSEAIGELNKERIKQCQE